MRPLEYLRDGAVRHCGLGVGALDDLRRLFSSIPSGPGKRLSTLGAMAQWLDANGAIGSAVVAKIGSAARAVRAIAFDKSDHANWALGWHQDRVIAVRDRREVAGFGPWTVKDGVHHVQPPPFLLSRMITVRVHLDPVDEENGPLRISPGTHRLGRIAESAIASAVAKHGEAVCAAEPGDVWVYSTPILHASERSAPGRRRRVLQVDYAADPLPGGLDWHMA